MKLPSPSTAIATVALIAAFGGTATAASVITGKDIKNSTVTGKDVKKNSLSASDLSKKARASLKGNTGPAGPQGPAGAPGQAGPKGETGAQGPAVLPSVRTKTLESENLTANDEETILSFSPPAGQYVIHAKVNMFQNAAGMAQCDLIRGNTTIDTVQSNPGGANERTPMSLQAVSNGAPDIAGAIKLNCTLNGTGGAVTDSKLTLIPVGSVQG